MKNILSRSIFVIVIIFICLYSISQNGYINKINLNKTLRTEDQINSFEKDISNNHEIINTYESKEIDYSNTFSNLGINISNTISKIYTKIVVKAGEISKYLFS